ncbi:MAG: hypothetical protein ACREIV_01670 [Planctomycetaceae bacterium]
MTTRLLCGATLALLGTLLTGCSSQQNVIRGQSPVQQAGFHQQHHFESGPACIGPQCGAPMYAGPGCSGYYPGCGCHSCQHHGHHCLFCCGHLHALRQLANGEAEELPEVYEQDGVTMYRDWRPTHYHWFSYEPPRNLVYPPARTPSAMVQYPYYTVKGPDDFFLDESPGVLRTAGYLGY